VITAIEGVKVDSTARLLAVLDDYKPGTSVRVTVWRDGKETTVPVKLQVGDSEE
jgi:S1-C subfamily serine protease